VVTRLVGGLTPGDGSDPRTFPAVETIESQGSAIVSQGSAISAIEADLLPTAVGSAVAGDSLVFDGAEWVNGPRSGNAIINGDFGIWQRGTSFTATGYTADRWRLDLSGASITVSRQAFTPADIEAVGYGDAEFFLRYNVTAGDDFHSLQSRIEDVRTLAGQTVTVSFWAKANASITLPVLLQQNFGSGGSANVNLSQDVTFSTGWQRFVLTYVLGSVSGKTIGAGNFLSLFAIYAGGSATGTFTVDLWGVQVEAGPVATPFKLAGGGRQGAELALCQRYFVGLDQRSASSVSISNAYYFSATEVRGVVNLPQLMRTVPSLVATTGTAFYRMESSSGNDGLDSLTLQATSSQLAITLSNNTEASGTAGVAGRLLAMSAGGDIGFDAEL